MIRMTDLTNNACKGCDTECCISCKHGVGLLDVIKTTTGQHEVDCVAKGKMSIVLKYTPCITYLKREEI